MAKRGRPTSVESIVGTLKCGPVAKDRLLVILENLASTMSTPLASRRLGLSESLFRRLRRTFLLTALEAVEPRPRGRPVREVSRHERRVHELERKISALEEDLALALLREELAVLVPWSGRRQKKVTRTRSSRLAAQRSTPPAGSGAAAHPGPGSPAESE
jgi:hypothetical protein